MSAGSDVTVPDADGRQVLELLLANHQPTEDKQRSPITTLMRVVKELLLGEWDV